MFSITRAVLMCQRQTRQTCYLKNGFQNICSREYSKHLLVDITKHRYVCVSKIFTFRFYCTTPTVPPSKPERITHSNPPLRAPALKREPPNRNVPYVTEQMVAESTRRKDGKIMTTGEKMKEASEDVFYGGIGLVGLCVVITVIFFMFREFFSPNSPSNIYSHSYNLVKNNQEVQDAVGMPMKCYGEEGRRGYRRHVAHNEFTHKGMRHIRMKYYVEGAFRKGTVHLEKIANHRREYKDYSYIIVDLDGYPPRRILVDQGPDPEDTEADADLAM